MGFRDKLLKEFVGAETRIDLIVVSRSITVIRAARSIIEQQRRRPDGCRAEIRDVVKVIDHALQVSAVAAESLGSVDSFHSRGSGVVRRIPIRESVRADQVDEVSRSETFPVGGSGLTLGDFIRLFECILSVFAENQIVSPGLCAGRNLDIREKVVGAVGLVNPLHGDASGTLHPDVVFADIRAVHQELKRCFHPCPPGKRLYVGHLLLGGIRNRVCIERAVACCGETQCDD